ncbi:MAG: mechanosensitive ion channel domain-containing protein, partial [Bacteroidota bacterium]
GFGIQHIFNDIVSGFVILFEGTIKVGDIIELQGEVSKVRQIDIRTTKVENRNGNFIIIPNSEITSNHLKNWSYTEVVSRHDIPIGVAYGSDTKVVKETLLQVAENNPHVKKDMPIQVVFTNFGDSALDFELRIWMNRTWEMDLVISDLRYAIDQSFREANISIPFPQRDVHIKGNASNP